MDLFFADYNGKLVYSSDFTFLVSSQQAKLLDKIISCVELYKCHLVTSIGSHKDAILFYCMMGKHLLFYIVCMNSFYRILLLSKVRRLKCFIAGVHFTACEGLQLCYFMTFYCMWRSTVMLLYDILVNVKARVWRSIVMHFMTFHCMWRFTAMLF